MARKKSVSESGVACSIPLRADGRGNRVTGQTLGDVLRRIGRQACLQSILALTDAQLLERFADGRDEPAFAALMVRHGPMVLGVCRRLLPDAGQAEDAFQAAFLVLAQGRDDPEAAVIGRMALRRRLQGRGAAPRSGLETMRP